MAQVGIVLRGRMDRDGHAAPDEVGPVDLAGLRVELVGIRGFERGDFQQHAHGDARVQADLHAVHEGTREGNPTGGAARSVDSHGHEFAP